MKKKRRKILRFQAVMSFFLLPFLTGCGSRLSVSPTTELLKEWESHFQEATEILANILLPNSMARIDGPRSREETFLLIDEFYRVTRPLRNKPEAAIPFLRRQLAKAGQDNDPLPGLCALQILYAMNNVRARVVIQINQTHSDEIISRNAKLMIRDKHYLFSSFSRLPP